jgi:two-component system chemotaxis response regulator CheB
VSKIKVLIIDDSALIRQVLTKILNSAPDIEVVGTAADPYIARQKIKRLNPEVLTLDIEMPRMDGLAFLSNLMRLRPMPVVMVSVLTKKGADITLQALEHGAVDFISKPQIDVSRTFSAYSEEIIDKIRAAARANIHPSLGKKETTIEIPPKYTADVILDNTSRRSHFKKTEKIISIGASTGGTEAIKALLIQMPVHTPGIVISQHIPAAFSRSFAMRMNQLSAMTVIEAEDNKPILPGHVYIAPGDSHLLVERSRLRYLCRLHQGKPVNRHRPSVDVLFRSMAQKVGPNGIGVILTGMGDDGACGIKEMRDVGATTLAQDEHTSVVWGMPKAAINIGAIDYVLSLQAIVSKLIFLCNEVKNVKR